MDHVRHLVHDGAAIYDGSISGPPSPHHAARGAEDRRIEPGRTPGRGPTQVRMLLSFQRPPRPVGKGIPSQEARPGATSDRRGPPSIARRRRGLHGAAAWRGRRVCGRGTVAASGARVGGAGRGAPAAWRGARRRGEGARVGGARRRGERRAWAARVGGASGARGRGRRAWRGERRASAATTAPAPTRSAPGGGRRSRGGRPAARCPDRARRRRSGSSRLGR